MSDVTEGTLVLFKRYGCAPESQAHRSRRWELGRITQTYFVGGDTWVLISPEKPEGPSAPTAVEIPLDGDHVDVIAYGWNLPVAEDDS